MADYLAGTLDAEQVAELEAHLSDCPTCKTEVDSYRKMWTQLGALPEESPGEAVRARFYSMLEDFKGKQIRARAQTAWLENLLHWLANLKNRQMVIPGVVAGCALFLGLFIGYRLQADASENRELALLRQQVDSLSKLVTISLLQQNSASERLRGVNYSYYSDRPDPKVIDALVKTLNEDPSLNVRLAAVDALTPYYEHPIVNRALLAALTRQSSPLLQIALIELFESRKEKQAIEVLNEIRHNDMLNQTVKQRAERAIQKLQ